LNSYTRKPSIKGVRHTKALRPKPVKKTEKKEYRIIFSVEGKGVSHLFDEEYEFTEEAAHKLSEAISALVEHTTSNDFTGAKKNKLIDKAIEAKASFQESQ
jgi:hypothetical protein